MICTVQGHTLHPTLYLYSTLLDPRLLAANRSCFHTDVYDMNHQTWLTVTCPVSALIFISRLVTVRYQRRVRQATNCPCYLCESYQTDCIGTFYGTPLSTFSLKDYLSHQTCTAMHATATRVIWHGTSYDDSRDTSNCGLAPLQLLRSSSGTGPLEVSSYLTIPGYIHTTKHSCLKNDNEWSATFIGSSADHFWAGIYPLFLVY